MNQNNGWYLFLFILALLGIIALFGMINAGLNAPGRGFNVPTGVIQ